jgi:hypothetical protein
MGENDGGMGKDSEGGGEQDQGQGKDQHEGEDSQDGGEDSQDGGEDSQDGGEESWEDDELPEVSTAGQLRGLGAPKEAGQRRADLGFLRRKVEILKLFLSPESVGHAGKRIPHGDEKVTSLERDAACRRHIKTLNAMLKASGMQLMQPLAKDAPNKKYLGFFASEVLFSILFLCWINVANCFANLFFVGILNWPWIDLELSLMLNSDVDGRYGKKQEEFHRWKHW